MNRAPARDDRQEGCHVEPDREQMLFPRTPLERLLSLKRFLEAERGHRVHMLASAEEKARTMQFDGSGEIALQKQKGRIVYWKKSVAAVNSAVDDTESLLAEMR